MFLTKTLWKSRVNNIPTNVGIAEVKSCSFIKKLYFRLFGRVEDALVLLDDGKPDEAKEKLLDAVEEAENTYIEADEEATEEAVLEELMALMRKALHRMSGDERKALVRPMEQDKEGE